MKTKHINSICHSERALCPEESIIKDSLLNGLPRPVRGLAMTPVNESGRSLVEMLGVLAVMGILTIGGIAGFNYAMDRYVATALIEEAGRRAVIHSQQLLQGVKVSDQEFGNNLVQGYSLESHDNGDEITGFSIVVKNVPTKICRLLAYLNWKVPYLSTIVTNNEEKLLTFENCNSNGQNQDINFAFMHDLSNQRTDNAIEGSVCQDDTACTQYGCSFCAAKQCIRGCPSEYHSCQDNQCVLSCPDSMIQRGKTCTCDPAGFWEDDGQGGCKCQNGYDLSRSHCCPTGWYWRQSVQECQDPETCWFHDDGKDTWDDSYALICQDACDEDEFYYAPSNCKGPTGKGECYKVSDFSDIRQPVYNEAYDEKGKNNLGTGTLLGEEEALRLTQNMFVSKEIGSWFVVRGWCLAQNARIATIEDMDCNTDNFKNHQGSSYCVGSKIVQALMALYGDLPTGKDAFFMNEKYDENCKPYHIWSEDGTFSNYGNRAYGSAALCIKN